MKNIVILHSLCYSFWITVFYLEIKSLIKLIVHTTISYKQSASCWLYSDASSKHG